jgi:hypothetical protein
MAALSKTDADFEYSNTGALASNPTRGMEVYFYTVFVLSCVWVAALLLADPCPTGPT